MLALAFLILIGVVLVAEGLHTHVPRGYIYFSMAFSLLVEMLNLKARSRTAGEQEHPQI
jgi:predicted tellurium resistance membrane protein TerC